MRLCVAAFTFASAVLVACVPDTAVGPAPTPPFVVLERRSNATKVVASARVRPEIVCGDPEPKRTLVVDLATGTASPR